MAGNSKVLHRVPSDTLVRLKPQKLGRHYHKVPQHIKEVSAKYPRIISDYFLRNYRINLELNNVQVHEQRNEAAECIYKSNFGKLGFAIERSLLSEALECYYGGTSLPNNDTPISTSEQRLRSRLGQDISQIFARALLGGVGVGKLEKHENEFDQAVWEYIAEFQFISHISGQSASIFVYLDAELVDDLTSRLSTPQALYQSVNPQEHIVHLPVRLECVLASLQMPLSQVLTLRPQDVLPIRLQERSEVCINQQKLFRGTIFEDDGALFLTSLESVKTV